MGHQKHTRKHFGCGMGEGKGQTEWSAFIDSNDFIYTGLLVKGWGPKGLLSAIQCGEELGSWQKVQDASTWLYDDRSTGRFFVLLFFLLSKPFPLHLGAHLFHKKAGKHFPINKSIFKFWVKLDQGSHKTVTANYVWSTQKYCSTEYNLVSPGNFIKPLPQTS